MAARLARTLGACAALAALGVPAVLGVTRSAAWNAKPVALPGVEVVLQSEENACGPAVIATLTAWSGQPVEEGALLALAHMGPTGITLAEFARLASLVGLPGVWYRVSLRELARLPTPFVAQLEKDGVGHFVAVLGVRHGFAIVADPAVGALSGSLAGTLPGFSGRVFLLERWS